MIKLFIPGRLCLLGEHTDWAAGYRSTYPNLEKGYALVVGTNQGIYADIKLHSEQFIIRSSVESGSEISLPMNREVLQEKAHQGGFFSYAAGVAYQCLTYYQVQGIEINNYLSDLPIQKGFASSAAICVLVARAFNRLYDLKLTIRGEMELAYLGERMTPSRCGKMDQACAYGNRPILMTFDGEQVEISELTVAKPFYFVIVDLGETKDTQEILLRLNQCYPDTNTEIAENVRHYLGKISPRITLDAVDALQQGDAEYFGSLMNKAQAEFDRDVMPACPSQLQSPILHQLLHYQPIQPYILGGKGIGSQGDGSAQFLVEDEEKQQKLIEIIEKYFPQMKCLKLTIPPTSKVETKPDQISLPALQFTMSETLGLMPKQELQKSEELQKNRKIRKAVIPAAGFGTRLFPATKVVKKELFPIIDRDGRSKPIILAIVEEAISAGVEEIAIVVQAGDLEVFESFFQTNPHSELFNKLSDQNQEYCQYLQTLGNQITFLIQENQEGYGHAVFCAKDWVKNEPFLLMLGDHVYLSETEKSCAKQLLEIYEQSHQDVIALTKMPADIIQKAGCVTGVWQQVGKTLSITQLYEKPTLEYAQTHLRVGGMAEDEFLAIFGLYALSSQIFDYLEENICHNLREKGEFQLTSCLEKLREVEGMTGYLVQGKCLDTGMPDAYRQAMIEFRELSS